MFGFGLFDKGYAKGHADALRSCADEALRQGALYQGDALSSTSIISGVKKSAEGGVPANITSCPPSGSPLPTPTDYQSLSIIEVLNKKGALTDAEDTLLAHAVRFLNQMYNRVQ